MTAEGGEGERSSKFSQVEEGLGVEEGSRNSACSPSSTFNQQDIIEDSLGRGREREKREKRGRPATRVDGLLGRERQVEGTFATSPLPLHDGCPKFAVPCSRLRGVGWKERNVSSSVAEEGRERTSLLLAHLVQLASSSVELWEEQLSESVLARGRNKRTSISWSFTKRVFLKSFQKTKVATKIGSVMSAQKGVRQSKVESGEEDAQAMIKSVVLHRPERKSLYPLNIVKRATFFGRPRKSAFTLFYSVASLLCSALLCLHSASVCRGCRIFCILLADFQQPF